ncbi:hypothetical protein AYO44_15215 [Planctomycetaceae bacterium SCGC AG-212-F19]|nr:hypothetical protein AYO44_15215 [Planctomycetaceae bacterium SCGC AG-212-F19]
MTRSVMLLAAAALLALNTASRAQDAPLKAMPAMPAAPYVNQPCATCATCTDCSADRYGGCMVRLRNVRSGHGSTCNDCCNTPVTCTKCAPAPKTCATCAPAVTTCETCCSFCGATECSSGCHRENSLRSFIGWLTYCPTKCGHCEKECTPCCTPRLYTFFLCQGCDSGCAIASCAPACEESCTTCKHGKTCEPCDSCPPKVWFEIKCLKRYQ